MHVSKKFRNIKAAVFDWPTACRNRPTTFERLILRPLEPDARLVRVSSSHAPHISMPVTSLSSIQFQHPDVRRV